MLEITELSLPADSSRYEEFQKRAYRPLAQHSLAWQEMLASWPGHSWGCLAAMSGQEIVGVLAFVVAENDVGRVLMSSPLPVSYGGVQVAVDVDVEEVYCALIGGLVEWAQEHRVDIVSILTSPFREDVSHYRKYLHPDNELSKFYQYLSMSDEPEQYGSARQRYRVRERIRASRRAGVEVGIASAGEGSVLDEWHDTVLAERIVALGSEPIPKRFYVQLWEDLRPCGGAEFMWARQNGDLIGGSILLFGWVEDIFLRLVRTDKLETGAGYLLDVAGIRLGAERGCQFVNWQSAPSRESGTYVYKKRWGSLEADTYYLVRITGDIASFMKAGRDVVREQFPYFFVLPYNVY